MINAKHPDNIRVLKKEHYNTLFNKQGYVVMEEFLKPAEVTTLLEYYIQNPNPAAAPFHTTHFAENKAYKQGVNDFITAVLKPGVDQHLANYIPVFGNYMIKEAGGNNPMPLHADWTYVNEEKNASVAIWIPLVDTSEENGCIGVIPFSQHLSHSIRGPRILQWEFPANEQVINALGKLIPMKAGQALIYNHRLLHYSPPNNSDKLRPAINLSLVPPGEPLIHYTVPLDEEKVHLYSVNSPSFYIHYDNFKKPELGTEPVIMEGKVEMLNERLNAFIEKFTPKTRFTRLLQFFRAVF